MLLKSLERIERSWIRRVTQEEQGVTRILREEGQGVLVDTIVTPKAAPREGHTVVQLHLLPESTRDLEWMN
jgi:hypothetical protein